MIEVFCKPVLTAQPYRRIWEIRGRGVWMNGIKHKQHDRNEQVDRNQDAVRGRLRKAEPVTALENARQAARMQANREELVERITRAVPQDGVVQVLEGLFLARA